MLNMEVAAELDRVNTEFFTDLDIRKAQAIAGETRAGQRVTGEETRAGYAEQGAQDRASRRVQGDVMRKPLTDRQQAIFDYIATTIRNRHSSCRSATRNACRCALQNVSGNGPIMSARKSRLAGFSPMAG